MMTQEYRDFYTSELKTYKTNSSKKAFLTRSKKECEEHLNDINICLKNARPMLHGEPKHYGHAMEMEDEVRLINRLYSKI